MLAYAAGLAWCFIIGVIVLLGCFVGPWIRKMTPRAAMLGTLAGISIAFISMRPAFQMWEVPWIGFVCFAIVLIAWTANIRLPGGIPGGLAAVIVGAAIGWLAAAFGWSDYMKGAEVGKAFEQFGLHLPWFSADVFRGLAGIAPLLATAIPLGIYNFTEAMNNVESASAAGDNYNLRKILAADGIGAIVGSMLGSPFPPAVYIGHPGWKSVGGRIGYSLATGVAIALVCFLGLTALLLNVIPLVAILPILLYIGLVIGAQAFQASPSNHAPAVVLAIIPNIAEWAKINIDGALRVAGTSADKVGMAALGQVGVVYNGLARARRRLGARGHGAGRDGGVHHRPQADPRRSHGVHRRGTGLRRPDPRAAPGLDGVAAGLAGLRDVRRGLPADVAPERAARRGAARIDGGRAARAQAGTMCVPVAPDSARPRLGGLVISARVPPPSRNEMIASILGPMLPFGNWPSARYLRASASVMRSSQRCVGLAEVDRHFLHAGGNHEQLGAEVSCQQDWKRSPCRSPPRAPASRACASRSTGMPPPPQAITM